MSTHITDLVKQNPRIDPSAVSHLDSGVNGFQFASDTAAKGFRDPLIRLGWPIRICGKQDLGPPDLMACALQLVS
jgi:hypothetical protein